jgi:hypothetical protein
MSHFLLMALFSLGVSVFFAFLLKPDLKSGLRFGVILFLVMVVGALALAWLMYPFPAPLSEG